MKKQSLNLAIFSLVAILGICCSQSNKRAEHPKAGITTSGNYVSDAYPQRNDGYDWVAVKVNELSDSTLDISVRSRADIKKPTCTFDAKAYRIAASDTFQAQYEGFKILFAFANDTLTILPESNNPDANLYYFCSGGATLEGKYRKLAEPLDTVQIDKAIFRKALNMNQYFFSVMVYGKTLTIQPIGLSADTSSAVIPIEGNVANAEIGDLNIDGFPEVLVYTQSAGSGSYGSVIGYSVNNGKSMSRIAFPSIADNQKANNGYMGHDEFAIVESTLVQRFPIYQPGDTNAKPTGGMRQLQYKLKDGETMRQFVIDKIVEY